MTRHARVPPELPPPAPEAHGQICAGILTEHPGLREPAAIAPNATQSTTR